MKLIIAMLAALTVAGSALAAPNNVTLTIQHKTAGCHNWSLDGKTFSATQSFTLVRGAVVSIVNRDVMPHMLIQVSGPKAAISTPAMNRMGAHSAIGFLHKGTYVFKTRAGEDYTKGIKTTGEDKILRLVVKVA